MSSIKATTISTKAESFLKLLAIITAMIDSLCNSNSNSLKILTSLTIIMDIRTTTQDTKAITDTTTKVTSSKVTHTTPRVINLRLPNSMKNSCKIKLSPRC